MRPPVGVRTASVHEDETPAPGLTPRDVVDAGAGHGVVAVAEGHFERRAEPRRCVGVNGNGLRHGCANQDGWARTLRCLSVPSQKKDRQWVSTRARAAAIEAAQRRQMRRRLLGAIGAGVLVIALVAAFALKGGGSKAKTALPTNTTQATTPLSATTSTTALPSAAGKPCVPVSD